MLPASTQFIQNASSVKSDSRKKVMEGFVSGSLDTFQKEAVDGILKGGMPMGMHNPSGSHALLENPKGVKVGQPKSKMSGKQPKTKLTDGMMPYPGSKVST